MEVAASEICTLEAFMPTYTVSIVVQMTCGNSADASNRRLLETCLIWPTYQTARSTNIQALGTELRM